jgi:hypothetical protein
MKRKSIFFVAVISAAAFVGIFINPSLVSTTKNKSSNLTLERISSYTGEANTEVNGIFIECCVNVRPKDLMNKWCKTTDYFREYSSKSNETLVKLCCDKNGEKSGCWSGRAYFEGNYHGNEWIGYSNPSYFTCLSKSSIVYFKCKSPK